MKENLSEVYSVLLISLLLTSTLAIIPATSATVTSEFDYTPFSTASGVIEADRFTFMEAHGNPLNEDIANDVFQGPGILGSDTVGYMKDIYLNFTKFGTLTQLDYTGEGRPEDPYNYTTRGYPPDGNRPLDDNEYHWLPVIEKDPTPSYGKVAPLEGWAIAYNMSATPGIYDEGYLVVTFSGFTETGGIVPSVIGQDEDDDWSVSLIDMEVWVDNPRLLAVLYNISAVNLGSAWDPTFELDIVVVFNKATKFVEIFQNLKLISTTLTGCYSIFFDMALARMAIFDANPYCDRAFYGWKNVTIEWDPDGTLVTNKFFMVLSYTNTTLEKWVHAPIGYDYYAAYMLSYPIPDSWAIASTWYDSNDSDPYVDAWNVWNAAQLRYAPVYLDGWLAGYLDRYVLLYMGDIDRDDKGDGDQALTRVEWYKDEYASLPEELAGIETGWKMVMYGVYDVNGTSYDGGEGGWFQYGYLCLSNGTAYEDDTNGPTQPDNITLDVTGFTPVATSQAPPYPPDQWPHTGTLGWRNGKVSDESLRSTEGQLTKYIYYLDIDQDGIKGPAEDEDGDTTGMMDEYFISMSWWPTEELWWQLAFKFKPPLLKKIPPSTCCLFEKPRSDQVSDPTYPPYDFTVLPAPGATTDAAGGAWLNARFTSWLVTFDVEAYSMVATAGYTNPANKMLPYLMLRLEPIPSGVEEYSGRRAHYLTEDGRALPQMEWEDIPVHPDSIVSTPWRDNHYLLVTVAGVHPNLATYYFNDFTPITRAVGGDYQWDIIVLPYGGPYDITPYVGTYWGLGVIALARDHFNNTALLVWGLDSQDTYWTAWYATWLWPLIRSDPTMATAQALLILIDYSGIGHEWGDGTGIPTAHPNYPPINDEPDLWILAWAREYDCSPAL